jgi:hypothetical protein
MPLYYTDNPVEVSSSQPTTITGSVIVSNFPAVQQVAGDLAVTAEKQKQLFDMVSDTTNYIGYAVTGSASSSPVWSIKKMSFDALGNLESSMWSSVSATWDNRSGEVYN